MYYSASTASLGFILTEGVGLLMTLKMETARLVQQAVGLRETIDDNFKNYEHEKWLFRLDGAPQSPLTV